MKKIRRLSLLLAIVFQSVTLLHAQGINTIQGRVITPDGAPPTAPVRLTLTLSGRRIYETFTDLSGRYSFTGLGTGTYQITAAGDGQLFDDTTVYAEVSGFNSSPQLSMQDIQLRPIKAKAAAPAGVVNAFAQSVPKNAREKVERAKLLIGQGKGELAMAQLEEAVRLFPNYFEAHLMIGNHLIETGRLDEAIAPLDRAREINPNDERVYQSFGLLMMKQRKYPIAVAIFEEAARLNPANPVNPLMRGSALVYQASFVEADKVAQRNDLLTQAELAFSKASELSDKRLKPDFLTMSVFYDLKGEPARAADELEDYLRKNPTSKNAAAIKEEISRLRSKVRK